MLSSCQVIVFPYLHIRGWLQAQPNRRSQMKRNSHRGSKLQSRRQRLTAAPGWTLSQISCNRQLFSGLQKSLARSWPCKAAPSTSLCSAMQVDLKIPSPAPLLSSASVTGLCAAGKPIFSLHGDEGALSSTMAVVQALMSFVQDQNDTLLSVM